MEYFSLKDFGDVNAIIHVTRAPYSPQQNDIVEKKNRTLKEMMNSMLLNFSMPNNLWGGSYFISMLYS